MDQRARVFLGTLFAAGVAILASAAGPFCPPETPRPAESSSQGASLDKWSLWSTGTHLRGANVYQRRVYPELDGDSMGTGPVGPPYTQEDFDRLSALGANYVNLSHPGLFTEKPPYVLDAGVQENLDRLIAMAQAANLYVVISFRTGPGRSEFTFFSGEAGTWFPASYLNDQVWKEQAAQDAWAAMWRATAERYRGSAVVVGYDLMVEPNANEVWLDLWDPAEFYARYTGTLYDWNPMHAKISQAIRQVDADTPILTGGMSYSSLLWLPYVVPTGDPGTVYTFHMYEPFVYTHQDPPLRLSYPGTFDADGDGNPDTVDKAWLDRFLATADAFAAQHGARVASNEFGIKRWEPGAAAYMADLASLLEQRGMNRALWSWAGSWEPTSAYDDFDFTHGPDPGNHQPVATSDLIQAVKADWSKNADRPGCGVTCEATAPATAQKDVPVSFTATATPSSLCTGSAAYDWDFGDGSAHVMEQSPSHAYAATGSYTWTMKAGVGGAVCSKTGAITIHGAVPGPTVNAVWKAGGGFKLKVSGANFDPGIKGYIGTDGSPWSNLLFKNSTYLILTGGSALKAKLPSGAAVPIRFVNPDGQSATFMYTR